MRFGHRPSSSAFNGTWVFTVAIIFYLQLKDAHAIAYGTIDTINGVASPFTMLLSSNGSISTIINTSTATTLIYVSLQVQNTCGTSALILPSYTIPSGVTAYNLTLAIDTPSSNQILELCYHDDVVSTNAFSSRFFIYVSPATLAFDLTSLPSSGSSTAAHQYWPSQSNASALGYPQWGKSYRVAVSSSGSADPDITFVAALLPYCTYDVNIVTYVQSNRSAVSVAIVMDFVSGFGSVNISSQNIAALEDMYQSIVANQPSLSGPVVTGRLCVGLNTTSGTGAGRFIAANSPDALLRFSMDFGLEIDVVGNLAIGGVSVFQNTSAVTVQQLYAVQGQPNTYILTGTNVNSTLLAAYSGFVAPRSYGCSSNSLANALALFGPGGTSQPLGTVQFAQSSSNAEITITPVNDTVAYRLCLFISTFPVASNVRLNVASYFLDTPATASSPTLAQGPLILLRPSYSSMEATVLLFNSSITFSIVTYGPTTSIFDQNLFTVSAGADCSVLNSTANLLNGSLAIVSGSTRYFTSPRGVWFTKTNFFSLCVRVQQSHFTQLSAATFFVVTPFAEVNGISPSDGAGPGAGGGGVIYLPLSGTAIIPVSNLDTQLTRTATIFVGFASSPAACYALQLTSTSPTSIHPAQTANKSNVIGLDATNAVSSFSQSSGYSSGLAQSGYFFLCMGDSTIMVTPLVVPLTGDIVVSFYDLLLAGASPSSSNLNIVSSGQALIGLLADPLQGLAIDFQLVLASPQPWNTSHINSTGFVLRLVPFGLGGNGCGSSLAILNLTEKYRSADDSKRTRFYGLGTLNPFLSNQQTGRNFICYSTASNATSYATSDSSFATTSFTIGVVQITSINDKDLTGGPPAIPIPMIQFNTVVWSVIGRGLSAVSEIRIYLNSVSGTVVNVTNDTYGIVTLSPQSDGVQELLVSLGDQSVGQTARYVVANVSVVGVRSIGRFGVRRVPVFSGTLANETIVLTSQSANDTAPLVCLSDTVDSRTAFCVCQQSNISLYFATLNYLVVNLTKNASFAGTYEICFQHTAQGYFSIRFFVEVIPLPQSIGSLTLWNSSNPKTLNILRGTTPVVVMNVVALPTLIDFSPSFSFVLFNINTSDLTKAGLSKYNGTCAALGEQSIFSPTGLSLAGGALSFDLATLNMSTAIPSTVPIGVTSFSGPPRRLCGAFVLANATSVALTDLTTDLGLLLHVSELLVDGLSVNTIATNSTIAMFAQTVTRLNITLPSFITVSNVMFGITSDSDCSGLTALSAPDISATRVQLNQLPLSTPENASSALQMEVVIQKNTVLVTTSSVLLCAQWIPSDPYTFTSIILVPVALSSVGGQALNDTDMSSIGGGFASLRTFTQDVPIVGFNVDKGCMQVTLLTASANHSCEFVVVGGGSLRFTLDISKALASSTGASTQYFTMTSSTPQDFDAMCVFVSRCSNATASHGILLRVPSSVLDIAYLDTEVPSGASGPQQTEISVISNIPKLIGLNGVSNALTFPITKVSLQIPIDAKASSTSSVCSSSNSNFTFDVIRNASNMFISVPAQSYSLGLYSACAVRSPSYANATLVYLNMDILLVATTIVMGTSPLGFGGNVSVFQSGQPEISISGDNLNRAYLYVAVTDQNACSSAALSGTNVVGISRTPIQIRACSSQFGSLTLSKPTNVSKTALLFCVASIPSSFGTIATPLSMYYVSANFSLFVTTPSIITVRTPPSSTANADFSLDQAPLLGISSTDGILVQNVPVGYIFSARWFSSFPIVQQVELCQTCDIVSTGDLASLIAKKVNLIDSAKFGYKYFLNYECISNSKLLPVNTSNITRGPCSSTTNYGRIFSSQCFECVTSIMTCNGSMTTLMRSSYWRANPYTDRIYDCSPPFASGQCQGGTPTGECTEGHQGIRCSECMPGYGKSFSICVQCGSFFVAAISVIAAAIVIGAIVAILTWLTVNANPAMRRQDHLPAILKMLFTHLAVASTIGDFSTQLPTLLSSLFSNMQSASRPSSNFAALDCSFNPSYYARFIAWNVLPAPILICVAAASVLAQVLQKSADAEFVIVQSMFERMRIASPTTEEDEERAKEILPFIGRDLAKLSPDERRFILMHLLPIPKEDLVHIDDLLEHPKDRVLSHVEISNLLHIYTEEDALRASEAVPFRPILLTVDENKLRDRLLSPVSQEIQSRALRWIAEPMTAEQIVQAKDYFSMNKDKYMEDKTELIEHFYREQRKLQTYELEKQYRMTPSQLFLVTVVVAMLLFYPSMIQESLNMIKCDTIDVGQWKEDGTFLSDIRHPFFFQRTLDCESTTHKLFQYLAYTSIFIYGLGFPIGVMLLVLQIRKRDGKILADQLFVFLVAGYDVERWWWEALILIRKGILAFFVVFIDDQRLQTYFAMWLLLIALVMHVAMKPYETHALDNLEAVSLSVVVATLNLSLLYDYLGGSDSLTVILYNVLTLFLLVINVAVIGYFVFLAGTRFLLKLQAIAVSQRDLFHEYLPASVAVLIDNFAAYDFRLREQTKEEMRLSRERRDNAIVSTDFGLVVDVAPVAEGGARNRTEQLQALEQELQQERQKRFQVEELLRQLQGRTENSLSVLRRASRAKSFTGSEVSESPDASVRRFSQKKASVLVLDSVQPFDSVVIDAVDDHDVQVDDVSGSAMPSAAQKSNDIHQQDLSILMSSAKDMSEEPEWVMLPSSKLVDPSSRPMESAAARADSAEGSHKRRAMEQVDSMIGTVRGTLLDQSGDDANLESADGQQHHREVPAAALAPAPKVIPILPTGVGGGVGLRNRFGQTSVARSAIPVHHFSAVSADKYSPANLQASVPLASTAANPGMVAKAEMDPDVRKRLQALMQKSVLISGSALDGYVGPAASLTADDEMEK